MFKFGQKEITAKDFYKQRQITDIFMIDVNKVIVSEKVSCNNGKDCRYIAGYQVDGALMPLFVKTPKNIFSYGVSQYDKSSAYTMSFNVFEATEWVCQYKKICNEVEYSYLKNWQQHRKRERADTFIVSWKCGKNA